MIRSAGTGKCPLSEKIYELFVKTNDIFRFTKGARIKLVSEEKGSTLHFHPADSCADVNRTINVRRRSSLQTTVYRVTNMSWNLRGIYMRSARFVDFHVSKREVSETTGHLTQNQNQER